MDVDSLQIAVSVQQQLRYLHTARECSPVKANVFFLNEDNPNKPTISQHLILLQRISNLGWRDFYANLVPDAAVSSFSKKQLHLVCMFVLCGPDHGRPASVILWKINNGLENQLKKYWNNINPTTYWNSYFKKKQKQQQLRRKAQLLIFSPPEYRVVIKERLLHYVKAVLMLHIASSYILIQDTCSRVQHVTHQLFPENLLSPVTKCFTVKIHTGNPS